jgi:hypothetical protein
MSVSEDRVVTVTAYDAEPLYEKVISVPAHYSLHEIHEAIRSEVMIAAQGPLTLVPPNCDLSSMIIASGEFFL